MNRLKKKYQTEIRPKLKEKFRLTNDLEVPRLEKIVVNIGVGEGAQDKGLLDKAADEIALITGQKALIAKARKSEAGFKLRAGQPIGVKVTLRGQRMYDFFDRLVNIVLPRVRDFRGLSRKSFDGHGNYSLGLREQTIFPEIEYSKIKKTRGLEVTIVMTTDSDKRAALLLELLGMPFEKET